MNRLESQATINWYNQNAPEYTRSIRKIVSEDQIKAFTSLLPSGARVLDAGCGGGRDAEIFAKQGYKVVGLDLSKGMLNEAKKTKPFSELC